MKYEISAYPPRRSKIRNALNSLTIPVSVDQFIAEHSTTAASLKTGVARHETSDGSKIAFGYLPDGTRVVYRMNPDGSIVGNQ